MASGHGRPSQATAATAAAPSRANGHRRMARRRSLAGREGEAGGGSVVAGWNAPNRLVIGRDVRPGQKIQLAIFGINGPLSSPTPAMPQRICTCPTSFWAKSS